MTTDAARKAVFNTPELLENIVSFLPHTDILTKVKRLSHQWKEVVDTSPVIKTKLWLRPQNPTAIQPIGFTDEDTFPEAPLWGKVTMPIYSRTVSFNPACYDEAVGSVQMDMMLDIPTWVFELADGTLLHPGVISLDNHRNSVRHSRLGRETSSSWRDMYLTDPPITTGLMRLYELEDLSQGYNLKSISLALRDHHGLTLGLVHDAIMAGMTAGVRGELGVRPVRIGTFYSAFR